MGNAREHEVRLMGLGLAALAVLATLLVIWFGATLRAQLPSHGTDASVGRGASGPSLVGSLERS